MEDPGAKEINYYWRSVDWGRLMRDFPPPPMYAERRGRMSQEEIRDTQETLFRSRIAEAWSVPFYRDRWSAAGLQPGDIESLDDLWKVPAFTSDDLRIAIEASPPFGNHYSTHLNRGALPLKLQTSGGTTGHARPTLFDPVAWEVQGIQMARALYAQGARPGDVGQITYTNALGNAAWEAYVGMHHWLGVIPVTAGTGLVTSSELQLEHGRAFGTNFWFGRGEYLARLAQVAEENRFDLRRLQTKFLHSFLGPDIDGNLRHALEAAWDAPVYDNYGTHEVGLIAFECPEQNGKHVNEDTAWLELVDVDSGELRSGSGVGSLVVTSLHRSVPPIIRYNLRDILELSPFSECACGLRSRKLSLMLGRADEMVKLRGTNVYPLAFQNAISRDARAGGDYLCVVSHRGSGLDRREEMLVRVERRSTEVDKHSFETDLVRAFRAELGVRVDVEVVDYGSLAEWTRLGRDKTRRLLDLRKA